MDISRHYFDEDSCELENEAINRHAKAFADMCEVIVNVTIEPITPPT